MKHHRRALLGMAVDLLSLCGRQVAGAAAGLFTIPLVARALGAEGLGAWALLGTTSFLVGLSDLGLSVSLQRVASRSDDAATRRLVRLTVLVVSVVGPCFCACAYALFLHLPSASQALQSDIARAAPVALAGGLVGTLGTILRAFLLIRGAFSPLTWSRTAASLLQIAVTAAGLLLLPSLLAPAAGVLAGAALELALLLRAARYIDPCLTLRPAWPEERAEVRDAFRQGAAALAINVGVTAAIRADVVILTAFLPLSAVGAYQVASRAIDQIFSFAKQTSSLLLHRLGDPEGRTEALRLGTAILGGLVSSGVVALALDGSALLAAWAGPIARDPIALMAVAVLGAAAILAAAEELASVTLTVSGATTWDAARPMVLGHVLNVALSLAGARAFGAWAVAGGTVCGNLLIAVLVWSRARALVGWRVPEVLWTLAPTGMALLVSLSAGWALAPLAARGAVASGLVCATVTSLGTAVALFVWWRRDTATTPASLRAASEDSP